MARAKMRGSRRRGGRRRGKGVDKGAPIRLWIEELRAPFFTATIVPVLLGLCVAWASYSAFDPVLAVLTIAGVLCLHAGTNVANDYFDHVSGNDEVNREYVRPFTGGSRLIQKGLLEPGSVLRVAIAFLAVGAVIGLVILLLTGALAILVLGAIGIFSGYFYTAPPVRLADRGLGEAVVGLNFGILVTVGAFFVQTLRFTQEAVVASLPVAFLIVALLYVNEFPDYRADKAVGKNNIVVRLGRRRAATGYGLIVLLTYGSILAGVALGILPQPVLLAMATSPLAVASARQLRRRYDEPRRLGPTCAMTVMTHFVTGILLSVGYLVDGLLLDGARIL